MVAALISDGNAVASTVLEPRGENVVVIVL